MNKANGRDGIPVELFQILKDDVVKELHLMCQHFWKTHQWPQDWKRSVFITIPKKCHAKECSNYCTIALISTTSKVILKILQARLQQYMNFELPMFKLDRFSKGRGTRDQIANIRWIIKKAREFQKIIYFHFTDFAKAFACVAHNKLWRILKEIGILNHLTCFLRNLHAGQEATVRTGGITNWFHIWKGVHQGCILPPCLYNLYAEYIMRNAGLDEAHAGITIARRNINNLRYADNTTLTAESEEELKSLLMKVKEESENICLKLTFRKLRSWHLVPSLHGKQMGKQWKQ